MEAFESPQFIFKVFDAFLAWDAGLDPFATWIISWTFTTKQSAWNFSWFKEATSENRYSLFPPTNGPSLTVVVSHKLLVWFSLCNRKVVSKKNLEKFSSSNGWSIIAIPPCFFSQNSAIRWEISVPKSDYLPPGTKRPREPRRDRSCHLPFCMPPHYLLPIHQKIIDDLHTNCHVPRSFPAACSSYLWQKQQAYYVWCVYCV